MVKLEQFLAQYRVKKFAKGEVILTEDERPSCAYYIKSGVVKTYNLTAQGQEKPISFDTEGQLFPVGWVFGKLRHTQYFYEAFTDCEVCCINRDEFVAYLKANPDLLYNFTGYMIKRYLQFQMRVNALEQSKAVDKVIYTLHFLCMGFGREVKAGAVQIQLPLTQQDLANFMGLTRETTGIELKKLERAKVIKYMQQRYVVFVGKLDELLDDDYDQGIILD